MNNKWKGKIASLCTERMQTAVLFACVMLGQIHWHCSGPTKKSVANLEFLSFPSCSGLAQSLREFKIPFIAYNQFLLLISSPLLATGQLKRVKRNEKQRGQIRKQKSKYFIMKGFFFLLNSTFSFPMLLFIYCRWEIRISGLGKSHYLK